MTPRCVLCSRAGALDRVCAFDVCEECRLGAGLADAQTERGFVQEAKRWTGSTGGDNPRTVYFLEVRIDLPRPPDAVAHFGRESGGFSFFGLFGSTDHQVGDALFDDFVFIKEEEGPDLAALLQDEALQSAIMELVSTGGVRLGLGWIRCRRGRTDGPPLESDLAVPMTLLALHLDRWVAQRDGRPTVR